MVLGMVLGYPTDRVYAETTVDSEGFYHEYINLSDFDGSSVLINVQGGTIEQVNSLEGTGYVEGRGEMITPNHYLSTRRSSNDLEIIIDAPSNEYTVEVNDAQSASTAFDFTDVPIKDGNHLLFSPSALVGQYSYYQMTLEKGREYIFTSSNRYGFDLLDPNGNIVKSFDTKRHLANSDVLFEYSPSVTGTYTYRSLPFEYGDGMSIGIYELIDSDQLVENDLFQIMADSDNQIANNKRQYFVKVDQHKPYLLEPEVTKNWRTTLRFAVDDVSVSDVDTGAYSLSRNETVAEQATYEGLGETNAPYVFYASNDTDYFWHSWTIWSAVEDDVSVKLNARPFDPKTGDVAKEHVKELNAEDRGDSMVADPVDAFAGNFVDQRTLLSYSGNNPLAFEWQYDSVANDSKALRGGFTHNFETFIKETDRGLDLYWTPNSVVRFEIVDGEYQAVNENQSGIDVVETDIGFMVTDDRQQEYVFDMDGKLLTFTDKVGHQTHYTYDGDQLVSVENSKGQLFTFS